MNSGSSRHILGVNCFMDDSAAALVRDGRIVAASEEERFARRKHTGDFPIRAIESCLEIGGVRIADIDALAFNMQPFRGLDKRFALILRNLPGSLRFGRTHGGKWWSMFRFPAIFRSRVPGAAKAGYRFVGVEHHLAHAASSFYGSPFDEALILSVDGSGEIASLVAAIGRGTKIEKIMQIDFPDSLGYFYSSITQYLGFRVHGGEGKVMGLASYGDDSLYKKAGELIRLDDNGRYRLNPDYFQFHKASERFVTDLFVRDFGPPREPESLFEDRHKAVAAALQHHLEQAVFHVLRGLAKKVHTRNLCVTGGVALNSMMNGKLLNETPFERLYLQPACHDAGGSLGAALYHYHHELGHERTCVIEEAYWGPEFTKREIIEAVEDARLSYEEVPDASTRAAELLAEGKIVGWFQGRMEFGPRALGNRSILADPRRAEMKDILNERVKRRESFRPFAPAVIVEAAPEYFDMNENAPFMLRIFPVRPEKRAIIPAVTHVDGTGRLQTVERRINPRYYDLIEHFGKLTGVPVVLNTSFNIRGEPIVCAPREAVACFLNTDMDYILLDNILLSK